MKTLYKINRPSRACRNTFYGRSVYTFLLIDASVDTGHVGLPYVMMVVV